MEIQHMKMCMWGLMELERTLAELRPFELSYFRHVCIAGYEDCAINFSCSF